MNIEEYDNRIGVKDFDGKEVINNNDFWFPWCCDCGLRHVYFFTVERGKTPKEDKISFRICRDDAATKYRKKVEKLLKEVDELKKKKKRKK
ncbi:unnamed protein product [marine sediment metagenome]|uniref:Uncharacterized protein n=1 Tax=marine sediment metagenome TaxID=412755 RepID=X0YN14_9ZZZZ